MKTVPLLGLTLLVTTSLVLARGGDGGDGDGFREGGMDDAGFRDEAPRLNEDSMDASVRQDDVNVDRDGSDVNVDRTDDDNYRVSDINGSAEMGIGNAANLHLAASSPEVTLAGTIPVTSTAEVVRTKIAGRKYLDDIIRMPFEYEGGYLRVPDGPGLGIEVDEEKLRRYALDA